MISTKSLIRRSPRFEKLSRRDFLAVTGAAAVGCSLRSGFACESNHLFTRHELTTDFSIFRRVLEEIHPGLYRYTSKPDMDAVFEFVSDQIKTPRTEQQFFQMVSLVISSIKCGHTRPLPSAEFMRCIKKMPLNVTFIGGRGFVLSSVDNTVPPGSELLTINGKSFPFILRWLLSHLWGDGDITTGKMERLSRVFSLEYARLIEQPDHFEVQYLDGKTGKKRNARLLAVASDEESPRAASVKDKKPYRFDILSNPRAALLRIESFDGGKDFHEFLQSSFRSINKERIGDLIVDLRDNSGGEDELGSLLFSYLTDREFGYFDRIETSTNKITLSEYTNIDDSVETMFANDLVPQADGRYRLKQDVDSQLQKPQQPQNNNFAGRVWVLINGSSFSTTADFCAITHFHRRAHFIGEEVGGGYYGNNSGYSVRLTLPNTKIRVGIPLWKYVNAVSGYAHPRRGVFPNFPITRTLKELQSGIDLETAKAYELIRR